MAAPPPRPDAVAPRWLEALPVVLFAALALRAGDYGVTWDEGLQADLGLCSWAHVRSAGANAEYERLMWDVKFFPPLTEMVLTAPTEWLGAPLFASRRALLTAVSGAGLLALARLAALLQLAPELPALAVLALLGLPRYVGDACANSKDAAFTAAFVGALPPLARWLGGGLRPCRAAAAWSALGLGLAASCRVQGLLLLPVLAGAAALELCRGWAMAWRSTRGAAGAWGAAAAAHAAAVVALGCALAAPGAGHEQLAARCCAAVALVGAPFAAALAWPAEGAAPALAPGPLTAAAAWRDLLPCAAGVVAVLSAALALVLSCWPALGGSPRALLRVLLANLFSRTYGAAEGLVSDVPTLFEGHTSPSSALPHGYAPRLFSLTTPLPSLALALLGAATLLGGAAAARAAAPVAHAARALVLMWLLLPLAVLLVARPNLYDGTRHLLFLQPCLALLAAVGALRCTRWVTRPVGGWRQGSRRAVALLGACALLLSAAPDMVALHPHQTAYFNQLAGGVAAVAGRPDGARSVHCGYNEPQRPGSANASARPLAAHCALHDTDYHVLSYGEAARWVAARHAELRGNATTTVVVSANHLSIDAFTHALPPSQRARIRVLRSFSALSDPGRPGPLPLALPADADFFVSTPRFGLDTLFAHEPVAHRVGRAGATFCMIKRNGSARQRARKRAETNHCQRALRKLYQQLDPSKLPTVPIVCGSVYTSEQGRRQLLLLLERAGGVAVTEGEMERATEDELRELRASGEAARTLFLRPARPDRWRNVTCGVHQRDLW